MKNNYIKKKVKKWIINNIFYKSLVRINDHTDTCGLFKID